ncbi:hypothetical protein ACTNDG_09970 [Clostridium sp. HCP1S3_B4]|uniref:hypothetical protein n=1 Tax=unclassified Clostridium TaxID=2614128 RepID=UPI003F8C5832
MLFKVLKNLIVNKYYSRKDIQDRIDVFMAYNRITEEQYAELMNLIDEVYKENIEENAETNTEDNTKENTEQKESTDKE